MDNDRDNALNKIIEIIKKLQRQEEMQKLYGFCIDDTPIYHLIPLEYFIAMVNSKKLILRRVDTWPDLNECVFDSIKVKYKGDTSKLNIFGSSWTKAAENDAMWRLYSPNKTSIRIKSTCSKLSKLIEDFAMNNWLDKRAGEANKHALNTKSASIPASMAASIPASMAASMAASMTNYVSKERNDSNNSKVDELTKQDIFKLHDRMLILPSDVTYIDNLEEIINHLLHSLLEKPTMDDSGTQAEYPTDLTIFIDKEMLACMKYKQSYFSHEKETRVLIYVDNIKVLEDEGKSLGLTIDPTDFIESITFDPRLSADVVALLKKSFKDDLGLTCPIEQSEMYKRIEKSVNVKEFIGC